MRRVDVRLLSYTFVRPLPVRIFDLYTIIDETRHALPRETEGERRSGAERVESCASHQY